VTSYTIEIPRWHPASLNKLMKGHWSNGHWLKKVDRAMVAAYATGVPKAEGKRRVSLHIVLDKGQRAPDPDAYQKSCLDALVHAGVLVDDNRQYSEIAPVTFSRNPKGWGTIITLEEWPCEMVDVL
jgi:Holliday junction resolvase RusA-like endonuclease